jgi:hypothetical protein
VKPAWEKSFKPAPRTEDSFDAGVDLDSVRVRVRVRVKVRVRVSLIAIR